MAKAKAASARAVAASPSRNGKSRIAAELDEMERSMLNEEADAKETSFSPHAPILSEIPSRKVRIRIRGLAPGLLFQGKGIMLADERLKCELGGQKVKPRPAIEEADLRCHWVGLEELVEEDGSTHPVAKAFSEKKAKGSELVRYHKNAAGKIEIPCMPWVIIYKALCEAAKSFKQKSGRKSMSETVAGTVSLMVPFCQKIPLETSGYRILEEFCRIPPRTGHMVLIGRPLFPEWAADFVIAVDDETWNASTLEQMARHAGKLIGAGAWRPQLKGPYGRFVLENFEILE
jgi:hypothetical protein